MTSCTFILDTHRRNKNYTPNERDYHDDASSSSVCSRTTLDVGDEGRCNLEKKANPERGIFAVAVGIINSTLVSRRIASVAPINF